MPMKSTCSLLTLLMLFPAPVLAQVRPMKPAGLTGIQRPMNLGESMPTGTTKEETFEPEAIECPVLRDGTIQPLNLSTFPFLFQVINPQQTQSVPTDPRFSGKLALMGLGGILGGLAGRYAVGGKRSNKTVLGTTIGAFAGSLVGRATC